MIIKWLSNYDRPPLEGTGIVIIGKGKTETFYAAIPIEADWGEGWELRKQIWDDTTGESLTIDVYHVNLNGQQSTCDCIGFEQHRHCKHVEGLLELLKQKEKR